MKTDNSKLLINEGPLQVLPTLAVLIGLNEAIILQQVHYWMQVAIKTKDDRKRRDGRWWVYNTYKEWQENFPWWSTDTIKRAILKLEKSGLLIGKELDAQDWDHTKWYSIDYDALNALSDKCILPQSSDANCDERAAQDAPNLIESETITETTTESLSDTVLDAWKELFPNKPQPRKTSRDYKERLRTRLKNKDFVENWRLALETAARSPALHAESWFSFGFFVRNDDNYQKMIDEWMSWKDVRYQQQQRMNGNGNGKPTPTPLKIIPGQER